MALIAKEIAGIKTTAEWIDADITAFGKYLASAGKGAEGNYEHYKLGQAIFHLREAQKYLNGITGSYAPKNPDLSATDGVKVFKNDGWEETPKISPINGKKEQEEAEIKDAISVALGELMSEYPEECVALYDGVEGMKGWFAARAIIKSDMRASVDQTLDVMETWYAVP